MSTTTLHPLAAAYLDRLRDAGRRLPRRESRELLDEVEAHLAETTNPAMSDAEVLTVLDRLGDPEDIVEEQQPSPPPAAAGAREWSAIVLLLFGGFIFGVGWLVGVVLLWSSRVWTARDKWIGTLFIPGGFATAFILLLVANVEVASPRVCSGYAGGPAHCTPVAAPGPSVLAIIVGVLVILAPIATAVYLGWRATRNPSRRAPSAHAW